MNKTQIAFDRQKDIVALLHKAFLIPVEGEDNSWRCKHNSIQLQLQFEGLLWEYLKKIK